MSTLDHPVLFHGDRDETVTSASRNNSCHLECAANHRSFPSLLSELRACRDDGPDIVTPAAFSEECDVRPSTVTSLSSPYLDGLPC